MNLNQKQITKSSTYQKFSTSWAWWAKQFVMLLMLRINRVVVSTLPLVDSVIRHLLSGTHFLGQFSIVCH